MSFLSNNSVYVVIPVYNEEKKVVAGALAELIKYPYNIIIVDDGSFNPVNIPANKAAIHLLRHRVNLGQGAALQTGIEFALKRGSDYIVCFDADGQHSAADIPAMLLPLQNKDADITLASRFLLKSTHNMAFVRKLVLKTGRFVNYVLSGLYLSDAHNGLRAMTGKAAEKINIKENRMAHATEILFFINKYKLKHVEVPANVIYTEYSRSKGQSVFNSIKIFFDLVLHKLFE